MQGQPATRDVSSTRRARTWTAERIARLGFLVGQGWTAKMIAVDPLIDSTPGGVFRQAYKVGLSLTEGARQGRIRIRLPLANLAVIERAAADDGVTREIFVRRFLIASTADPRRFGAAD